MSIPVINRVLENSQQRGSSRVFLFVVANYSDLDGISFPGLPLIASQTRISVRQCKNILKALRDVGELYISFGGGSHNTNAYFITAGLDETQIATVLSERFLESPESAALIAKKICDRQNATKAKHTDSQVQPASCDRKTWGSGAKLVKHTRRTQQDKCKVTQLKGENLDTNDETWSNNSEKQGINSVTPCRNGEIATAPEPIEPEKNPQDPSEICACSQTPFHRIAHSKNTLSAKASHARRIKTPSDPLLQHSAIQMYRTKCKLLPNQEQRQLIADTVVDFQLWESVLAEWLQHGWNPRNVSGMIDRYKCGNVGQIQIRPPTQQRNSTPYLSDKIDESDRMLAQVIAEAERRSLQNDRIS